MTMTDMVAKFGQKAIEEHVERMNPLDLAETREFNRRIQHGEYQDRAIDYVINGRLPFASTGNSAIKLMKRFVAVTCPYCGQATVPKHAGGTSHALNVDYHCENKHKVTLTIPWDVFSAAPE